METTLNTGEKRMVAKYKYMKHSTNQLTKILTAAEDLFIKKGIEAVSFTEIASCCGITRSTLYRYFENKDEILWEIHHRKIGGYSSRLMEYYEQTNKTTYSRFQCFFHLLKHILCTAPHYLLFQSAFSHTYTRETMDMENGIYNHIFSPDEFRSGDMLRFLKGSLFHDGSICPDLDPDEICAAAIHSGFGAVTALAQSPDRIIVRYHTDAVTLADVTFSLFLKAIKKEMPETDA